jgi:hypothetical protein
MAKKSSDGHRKAPAPKRTDTGTTEKISKRSHIGDSKDSIENTRKAAEIPPKKKDTGKK